MKHTWLLLSVLLLLPIGHRATAADADVVDISVDLTEAPRRMVHSHLTIPVKSGPITLYYPKWIPGEHGPNGPITDVAGLKLQVGEKTLTWKREPTDMFTFHCDIPESAQQLHVHLDFLEPPPQPGGFTSGSSTTDKLAILNWNQVVLYPKGADMHKIQYRARVKLPSGWKFGTALPFKGQDNNIAQFEPVTLERLIDSPLLTGQYFREVHIGPKDGPQHYVEVAGDTPGSIVMSPALKQHFDNLVAQTGKLFGARHYRSYRFLITLSDYVAHFGEEHHESTDIRMPLKAFIDAQTQQVHIGVVAHEFTHSWNGKYRRPAGLVTKDYQEPERTGLLWVYEGLTQYLGTVLTARAGFWSVPTTQEYLATVVQGQENQKGRSWRPLEDTAVAAQLLYAARADWFAWRRSVDYYDEGTLLWLDVDTLIRERTNGEKSIDDFCRAFHGGSSGAPKVVPYTLEDVVHALNAVTPYDWAGLLKKRVTETAAHAPLDGVHRSGWRLTYDRHRTEFERARAAVGKILDLTASIGLLLNDDGVVIDVIPGTPADHAKIGPGMKTTAVDGQAWSSDAMRNAVRDSDSRHRVRLLLNNDGYIHRFRLDYRDGARYPKLERESDHKDVLVDILKAKS